MENNKKKLQIPSTCALVIHAHDRLRHPDLDRSGR